KENSGSMLQPGENDHLIMDDSVDNLPFFTADDNRTRLRNGKRNTCSSPRVSAAVFDDCARTHLPYPCHRSTSRTLLLANHPFIKNLVH
ncbi:hypothetical protein CEXT_41361, partial [Caerostris extrusa]